MEGKPTTLKHRIRKTKKILPQSKRKLLRKVKNEKYSMSSFSKSTMKSATLAGEAPCNSEEENESLDNEILVNNNQEEENEDSVDDGTLVNENGDASFGSISSPICIEMRGEEKVPSNLFNNSVSRYQMQVSKRVVSENEYSVWKQSNLSIGDKWKVQVASNQPTTPLSNLASEGMQYEERYENSVSRRNEDEMCDQFSGGNNMENSDNICPDQTSFRLLKISEDRVLLVLPPGHSVHFSGLLELQVLVGTVEVLGYEINFKSGNLTVYSPWRHSMLGICAYSRIKSKEDLYFKHLENRVSKITHIDEATLRSFPTFSCLILLKQAQSILPLFLNKYFSSCFVDVHPSRRFAPEFRSDLYARFFDSKILGNFKAFTAKEEWNAIARTINKRGSPKVMVFGGKNVGKSSFLRFLTNRMISYGKKILFIDLDPGQCEFTPPGCVSAVIVEKPLLGPNFTHLLDPERCIFIGRVNIATCVSQYVESVKDIMKWCSSEESVKNIPWFINTMGFTQGVGVDLALSLIKLVCPTDLIQIQSKSYGKNFTFELTSTSVNNMSVQLSSSFSNKELVYNFHSFESEFDDGKRRYEFPSVLREIAVLAYFSKCILGFHSLLSSRVYKFPFKVLKLCICHEKVNYSHYLSAMNANVVALCNVGENNHGLSPTNESYPEIFIELPICDCYGMGIVRGVDMEQKMVFITSPLPLEKLRKVNCLVLGEVYLPTSVYTNQNVKGNIPYVVIEERLSSFLKEGKDDFLS